MSKNAADQDLGLSLDQARRHILDAALVALGTDGDPRIDELAADAEQDAAFASFDFDSLAMMEFCLRLEDTAGIEIDPGDLVQHPSLNAMAAELRSRSRRQ